MSDTIHACPNYSFRHSVITDSDEAGKCGCTFEVLMKFLKGFCKAWCFQKEKSDTGYIHWQGHFSLIKKRRKNEILNISPIKFMYLEPLLKTDVPNLYSIKEDTRIDGPWTDKDQEVYVPRQYRDIVDRLHPFQKDIWNSFDIFCKTLINLVYCPKGLNGKSSIAAIMHLHKRGIDLPAINDCNTLMQILCDICMDNNLRTPGVIFMDLPRAMGKDKLIGIFSAIECIKKGHLYETRYKYRDWWIDSPQIWIFTNEEPNLSYLSMERWRIWTINSRKEFQKYNISND